MKKILIATDFSPAARNATDYALRLAEPFNAAVVLMSAYEQEPVLVTETPMMLNSKIEKDLAQRQLEQEVDNLMVEKPKAIDILVWKGSASHAIVEAAEHTGADLIVVGMTGERKKVRKIFGSTATGLARKTTVPLLVVPERARFEKPAGIALAEEVMLEKDQVTPVPVLELLEKFHATLYLVRIFNRESGEIIEVLHTSANRRRRIGAFTPLGEMSLDNNIARALENVVETQPISILVLRPEPKSLLGERLYGSTTREMLFDSSIPLLILPPTHHE